MKTVIEMARQSGYGDHMSVLHAPALERFAELARADERARMAEQPAQQEPVGFAVMENPITPPAQRTWVGLTDEDIEQEFGFIDELLRDCVHRTEAKVREKNT